MEWIVWIVVLLVIAGAVAGVVAVIVRATAKTTKTDHALLVSGGGTASVQPQLYAQGMNHRSTATTFGVIGLFVLGIVFGPLSAPDRFLTLAFVTG
jgi:hypothetical protein